MKNNEPQLGVKRTNGTHTTASTTKDLNANNRLHKPGKPQPSSPSPPSSSSSSSSSLSSAKPTIQRRSVTSSPKKTHMSFHIRCSHIFFAVCVLISAMFPVYYFDSPQQFLGAVNAFFFPPLLGPNTNPVTNNIDKDKDQRSSILSESNNGKTWSDSERFQTSGWRLPEPEVLAKYDPGICGVERISASELTGEIFESRYRFKKPVLVTFSDGAAGWTDPSKWTRSSLVKEYSRWVVRSGTSLEIVRKGGNGDEISSFLQFVNKLQQRNGGESKGGDGRGEDGAGSYMFDRDFYFQSDLPKTLMLPSYFTLDPSQGDESIFFLGASLSGVVFHKHSDTWNGVIYGNKRWLLYPSTHTPPGGVYNGFSILDWLSSVYPHLSQTDKPLECVQRAGEILYLPEGTYHATLNFGDTVAFAIQKKLPTLKTEILFYEATDLANQIQSDNLDDNLDVHTRMLQIFIELNKLLPESAEVMMKMGECLYNLENYKDAIEWFKAATRKDPYFVNAYVHMGKAYSKMREYEQADALYKKALAMSPNLWDVYKEYGEFLLRMGRHADALPIFKKGTELMPKMIPFWFFYQQCQMKAGDWTGAEATDKIIASLKANSEH